jgi:hypothetical protein
VGGVIPVCDYGQCEATAEYVIRPKHGHPGDEAMACSEHVGAILPQVSSLGEFNWTWQVDVLVWMESAS